MKNNNLLIKEYFSNNFVIDRNIFVISKDDKYTDNFSNQWKDFNYVQVDSFNKTKISEDYLRDLLFNDLNQLKNKNILEIGCGAGRFTEHIVKYSNLCVSIDLSKSIYYNVSKDSKNLILIKSDFLKLKVKKKFDIVVCRGVLQHTPDPDKSILKLFDFIDEEGLIFFDYYKKPKIGFLHPKYIFWRPFIRAFFNYNSFKFFLEKNINTLIKIKNFFRKICFNSFFISDCLIPIWDFREKNYKIDKNLFTQWTILDTLDGIFAKYDFPKSNKELISLINANNFKILKNNSNKNYFCVKKFN